MRKDKHIHYGLKAAAWMGALLFFACTQDEEVAVNGSATSEIVTFAVSLPEQWQPDVIGRSVSIPSESTDNARKRTDAMRMNVEGDTYPGTEMLMYMMEEDYSPVKPDTLSVDSRSGESKTPDIGIYAYEVPTDKVVFGEDGKAIYNASVATPFMNTSISEYTDGTEKKFWPGGGSYLQFFAYLPYCKTNESIPGLKVLDTDNIPKFCYKVPADDVDKQNDLQVAKSEMLKGDNLQTVQLNLKHVLSKVQVKMGNVAKGKIMSISFKNIGGEGTYNLGDESWTVTDIDNDNETKTTYTQTFENGYIPTNDKIIGAPFYLIPQTLPDDASIAIEIKVETVDPHNDTNREDTYFLTKKLKGFVDNWYLDKQYTFIITSPQQVDVEVTDRVVGRVKQDLVIKNTGMSPAYIRAAIIGNWVQFDDEQDFTNQTGNEITEGKKIVAEWKDTDGVFDWGHDGEHKLVTASTPNLELPEKCWIKCSDGFYYYTKIVQPGEELKVENNNALFNTYTLNDGVTPMADAVLELIIAVQTVYPDDVGILWKEEIKSLLKMNNPEN